MHTSYWDYFRRLASNRKIILSILFVTILSFGFTITHFSIGIDDAAAFHYLHTNHTGSMIQQGRLLHVVYQLLTNALEFLPFFNDFLGAAIYALSVFLFCSLLSWQSHGKLSDACLIIFCAIYISSPIIHEKWIYNLDVVVTMLSYCTTALAMVYACQIGKNNFLKATILLIVSIASYESFGFVYVCTVFAIFIIRIVVNQEELRFSDLLRDGLRFALILICAYILYYSTVVIVQLATGQFGLFSRNTRWNHETQGVLYTLFRITLSTGKTFLISDYLPIQIFTLISVIGCIFFIVLSLKNKNIWIFACYCGLFAANFLIHYAFGNVLYRASQTFCFFTAFVIMVLIHILSDKHKLQKIIIFLSAVLILIQAAELNRWFYNDYIRYEKESAIIRSIAEDIMEECDIGKPVVFILKDKSNWPQTDYYPGSQANGNPVLPWAVGTFDEYSSPMMFQLFRMHGYDFLVQPTDQQAKQAMVTAGEMKPWPQNGYLKETEQFIFIRIG